MKVKRLFGISRKFPILNFLYKVLSFWDFLSFHLSFNYCPTHVSITCNLIIVSLVRLNVKKNSGNSAMHATEMQLLILKIARSHYIIIEIISELQMKLLCSAELIIF